MNREVQAKTSCHQAKE